MSNHTLECHPSQRGQCNAMHERRQNRRHSHKIGAFPHRKNTLIRRKELIKDEVLNCHMSLTNEGSPDRLIRERERVLNFRSLTM